MNTALVITTLVSAIVTWVFMYIDARLFDAPKTKLAYIKGMAYVAAVSASIVYFMGNTTHTGAAPMFGGSGMGGGTTLIHGINEEIFTGVPSF